MVIGVMAATSWADTGSCGVISGPAFPNILKMSVMFVGSVSHAELHVVCQACSLTLSASINVRDQVECLPHIPCALISHIKQSE